MQDSYRDNTLQGQTAGREPLFGKTLSELEGIVAGLGMPRFTAKQIAEWLYGKNISSIGEMSNISLKNRDILEERYTVGLTLPAAVSESSDGTKKYLFRAEGSPGIETAYIPDGERATLCVSCQVGCRMGCVFCMTGKQGLSRNLTSGEILNQFSSVPEHNTLTNIVYMGMGEPLDNLEEVLKSLEILTAPWGYGWSPGRITVSTAGIRGKFDRLLDQTKVNIAVSLHNPFSGERQELMPAEKAFPAEDIIEMLRQYDFSGQRRVSFEYIVFKGLNDTPAHVKGLAKLLNGLKCRINLIRFHAIPGSPFESPDIGEMKDFADALNKKGIMTTVRRSRGEDIKAACGLLSTDAAGSAGKGGAGCR